jgi:thiol-disulfide isomerase/thioredoxin
MPSQVRVLDFAEFKKTLDAGGSEPLDGLVKKCGVVYVVMVTRDGCSSCQEQKPMFEKLPNRLKKKYADQTEFLIVHSSYSREREEEAKQCLDAFHTAGFPTYIIAVRDNEGKTLETYRSLDAPISEIERNIEIGITLLGLIRERSETHA